MPTKVYESESAGVEPSVNLENALLKVAVDSGQARVISVFDKRTRTEILPGGGFIQIEPCQFARSLTQTVPPSDADEAGSILFGRLDVATGLSQTIRIQLPSDRAEFTIEVRTFNRGYRPTPYRPAVDASASGVGFFLGGGGVYYDTTRRAGLALWAADQPMDCLSFEAEQLRIERFPREVDKLLGPRQLDVFSVVVQPVSGLASLEGLSREAGISLSGGLQIQAASARMEQKVVLLTKDGRTLEAPVHLYPEHVAEIALEFEVTGVAIKGAEGEILMQEGPLEALAVRSAILPDSPIPAELPVSLSEAALQRATFDPSLRHLAHSLLGRLHMRSGKFQEAALDFESALLFNAEDAIVWWAKGLAHRLAGEDEGERPELLNAHFLAPLDPLLRADAFLSQPQSMEKDANPLLQPFDDVSGLFEEVAAQLIELGRVQEAARWIDEALRHPGQESLRHWLAYCHVMAGSPFEAAKEIKLAEGHALDLKSWRAVDWEIGEALLGAFPESEGIKRAVGALRRLDTEPGRTF